MATSGTPRRSGAHRSALADRAGQFRALSDETRTQIVELLAAGELCVCELAAELDIAQPLLSFHLRALRESGLVSARRDGRWAHYALDAGALQAAGQALTQIAARHRELTAPGRGCC